MDTPYKWPPGRDYRGYSIRTLFCRVPFGEPHVGSNATASLWQCGVNLRAHGGLKRHQDFELVVKPLSPGGLTLCALLTQCGRRAWKGFSLPIPSQHRAKSPRLNGSGGAQGIGLPIAATSTRASSRYEEGRCAAASPLCIRVLTRFTYTRGPSFPVNNR